MSHTDAPHRQLRTNTLFVITTKQGTPPPQKKRKKKRVRHVIPTTSLTRSLEPVRTFFGTTKSNNNNREISSVASLLNGERYEPLSFYGECEGKFQCFARLLIQDSLCAKNSWTRILSRSNLLWSTASNDDALSPLIFCLFVSVETTGS